MLNDTHWLLQFIYQLLHVSLCLTIKDKKVIFPISPQLTHLKFIFNILFFSFCVIFDLIKLIQKFESDFILSHVIAKVRSLAVVFLCEGLLSFAVQNEMKNCNLETFSCDINNGNWTEWSEIWAEIIRVISKSN